MEPKCLESRSVGTKNDFEVVSLTKSIKIWKKTLKGVATGMYSSDGRA